MNRRLVRHLTSISGTWSPNSIFLRNDPWKLERGKIDKFETQRFTKSSKFARNILEENHEEAWNIIEPLLVTDNMALQKVPAYLCSKFLSLLPDGSVDGQVYWPRALKFAEAMQAAGHSFTSSDYVALINLSFKARQYDMVEDIWHNIQLKHRDMLSDVNLWNAYIQATCQAYPLFWPIRDGKTAKRISPANAPPLLNSITDLLKRMDFAGVASNHRTYELSLMAFSRQGRLDIAKTIINQAWLNEDASHMESSLLYPNISTLTAITEGFAFNDELQDGMNLAFEIQQLYNIPLNTNEALNFWIRLFRHISVSTAPKGYLGSGVFNQMWALAIDQFKLVPNAGLWSLRIEHLNLKNQFDELAAQVEPIMNSTSLPKQSRLAIAASALTKAARGYTNKGRALDALALLQSWSNKGLDLRMKLEGYVSQRSGGLSFKQLEMFKDDDDDDNFMGV